MLFSVVIPVYNVEKYLDECIQSVISQIDTIDGGCEVLLIDDGSTDNSGKICDEYKQKYPEIIKVFHKENQGLLLTRRYGFERAFGTYIINCDSDDLFEKGMLATLEKNIIKYNKPDIMLFNYYKYINEEDKHIAYSDVFSIGDDCLVEKETVLQEFLKNHSVVSLCCKICNRNCFEVKKNYEMFSKVGNGEDTLQTIELFNNAQSFVYINKAMYDYRMGSGMTGKFDSNYYWGFKKVLLEIWKQKNVWNIIEFNSLFSVKVLQTAGRAISQSRYNKWDSTYDQMQYLMTIGNDSLVKKAFNYMYEIRKNLQRSHLLLLVLIKHKQYWLICLILKMKNKMWK